MLARLRIGTAGIYTASTMSNRQTTMGNEPTLLFLPSWGALATRLASDVSLVRLATGRPAKDVTTLVFHNGLCLVTLQTPKRDVLRPQAPEGVTRLRPDRTTCQLAITAMVVPVTRIPAFLIPPTGQT